MRYVGLTTLPWPGRFCDVDQVFAILAWMSRHAGEKTLPFTGAPIPVLLRRRAEREPDNAGYTFIDYARDPAGHRESLTWSQVLSRSQALAGHLASHTSPGDRAAILAPQGLDYIVAFFGAIEAGLIAVPLSVPQYGAHDERVASALWDSQPSVVLTTSAVSAHVRTYIDGQGSGPAPTVLELDTLDMNAPDHTAGVPGWQRHSPSEDGVAYLQYTSGSTRAPAGVVITHKNLSANLAAAMRSYFGAAGTSPPGITWLSWLPFYHDLGLMFGIAGPMLDGRPGVSLSPQDFLQRPARWMQLLATHGLCWSGAPNFAFDLVARRTADVDLAGLDLSGVWALANGGERIHVPTARRFLDRFAPWGLSPNVMVPSYGLAESTLYIATSRTGEPPDIVGFDYSQLAAGRAVAAAAPDAGAGPEPAAETTELIGFGAPNWPCVRIVDPQTCTECPDGTVGELWTRGDSVGQGYWRNPEQTAGCFDAQITDPGPETPPGPWLRTGDLAVSYDGRLFIIGRLKDLLIVDGRNHYPDDLEATVREITGGRVAAIAVTSDATEKLVTVVEMRMPAAAPDGPAPDLRGLKRQITAAVARIHSVRIADLVLVAWGSIPVTTSGKIRRSACAEIYRRGGFTRLDSPA